MMFFHHCHTRYTLQLLDAFAVVSVQLSVMENHFYIRCGLSADRFSELNHGVASTLVCQ